MTRTRTTDDLSRRAALTDRLYAVAESDVSQGSLDGIADAALAGRYDEARDSARMLAETDREAQEWTWIVDEVEQGS